MTHTSGCDYLDMDDVECTCHPNGRPEDMSAVPVLVTIQFAIPGEMTLAEVADRLDETGIAWTLVGLGRAE